MQRALTITYIGGRWKRKLISETEINKEITEL